MKDKPAVQQSSLFVRPKAGAGGRVYWDAQWRYRVGSDPWRQKTRRLGPAWQEPDPEPTPPIAEASDQPKWKGYLEPSDNGERGERATPPEPESSPRWFTAAGAWAQEPETNQVPAAEAEGAAYQQPAPPEAEAQGNQGRSHHGDRPTSALPANHCRSTVEDRQKVVRLIIETVARRLRPQ